MVHVVVYDEGMYRGNGVVHRWLVRVGNRLYQNTVAAAPERTGDLKAGIELDFTQGPSLRVTSAIVSSTAPHTMYVIHGTANNGTGYIYRRGADRGLVDRLSSMRRVEMFSYARDNDIDTTGLWMKIDDGGPMYHLRVHGQRANNFLLEGYSRTQRTHRSLHGLGFPGIQG